MDCTGAVITASTPNRKAVIQYLSPYTYYQFKVYSKNGVSHLAEMNGEKTKYAAGLVRTGLFDTKHKMLTFAHSQHHVSVENK